MISGDFSVYLFNQNPFPMKTRMSRRSFVARSSGACLACCVMMRGGKIMAAIRGHALPPDPEEYTYCGYRCEPGCPLLKATREKDTEAMRKVFDEWGAEEKFDIRFDPEIYFCYGCKNNDQPKGIIVRECSIIPCAREKGYESCFQCQELATCDKELWKKYPEHRKHVLDLQKEYFANLE